MNKDWSKLSLFFLFCIAGLGTLLRALPFFEISVNYSNLVHAHSHVAFQGWVYTALLLLIPHLFLNKHQIEKGRYKLQFKITIPLIIAILIAFSIQGYAFYSIALSTIFQGMNYWFIFRFFIDSKSSHKNDIPLLFVKIGFLLGLISSLAPYFVGYLSARNLSHTETYEAAVYFFLHFQYNGWFLFAVIGVIFKTLEQYNISFNKSRLRLFLIFLTVSSILTYLHSLLGMSFRSLIMIPAVAGIVLQLLGIIVLISIVKELQIKTFFQDSKWLAILMITALSSLILKSLLQFISVLPSMQFYAFSNRSLIMAYMHLCLIGLISFSIISIFIRLKWLTTNSLSKFGYVLLYSGFILSELILLFHGIKNQLPGALIIVFSAFMALGVFLLMFSSKISKAKE